MKLAKILESIGESVSLNEFDCVEEMLQQSKINTSLLSEINTSKIELVCAIFPEQDEPDEDDDSDNEEGGD